MLTLEDINIIPFPFNELKVKFRRKHKLSEIINKISYEYFENNEEGIKKIRDYFSKKINDTSYEITYDEEKQIEKEFKNFDAAFGIIFDEINNMDWKEKREIYVTYYYNTVKRLKLIINSLFKEYSKRNDLGTTDFLLYNYLKLLLSLNEDAMDSLQISKNNNFNKYLVMYNYTVLYFILPLYNYREGIESDNELLDKMSELASLTVMDIQAVPKNVKNLLDISKDTSLYKVLE